MSAFSAIRGLIESHPQEAQKLMSRAYIAADIVIATVPLVQVLCGGDPSWAGIWTAYSATRILPFISGVVQFAGDKISGTRFGWGHALIGTGVGILGMDSWVHGQYLAGAVQTLAGAAVVTFGAPYKYLENFRVAKEWVTRNIIGRPKRMAGICLGLTSIATVKAGLGQGGFPGGDIMAAGLLWCVGNIISAFLPADDESDKSAPARSAEKNLSDKGPAAKLG